MSAAVTAERRFHLAFTAAIAAAMALGFARTFFLRPLFPETQALAAPEPYFYVHGVVFTAWFVLLIAQATLISQRRVQWHRHYELVTVAFLVPMVVWDLRSRGRLHPATVLGLVVIPAMFMARLPLAATAAWQTLGRAAIALVR